MDDGFINNFGGNYVYGDWFLCNTTKEGGLDMEGIYVILIGLIVLAVWALIVSYREDHPKKKDL